MERFWQWLMKANARGVFVFAVVGLLLITAFVIRRELNPPRDGLSGPVSKGNIEPKPRTHLAVLDYVRDQLAIDSALVPESPFRPARTRRVQRRIPRGPDGRIMTPEPVTADRPKSRVPPRRTPVQNTPGGPKRVTLIYRGIFTRSDGATLALVEDSETGRSMFRGENASLSQLTIGRVATDSLTVITADGNQLELQVGQPATFIEGHYEQPTEQPAPTTIP